MPTNPQRRVALITMAYRGCLAHLAIVTAISPFRSAKRVIKAYRAIRVGGWRRSRWHGKASLWATSAGRSRIRRVTGVETWRYCMITCQTTTWWDGRGSREPDGNQPRERRSNWAISCKPGSIPAPSVRDFQEPAGKRRGNPSHLRSSQTGRLVYFRWAGSRAPTTCRQKRTLSHDFRGTPLLVGETKDTPADEMPTLIS